MKYFIFADEKEVFTKNENSAIMRTDNYDEAFDYFRHINNEFRYSHSYLIAYFGYGKNRFFSTLSLDNVKNEDNVPFFVIGEFHYDAMTGASNVINSNGELDLNLTIRKDYIIIERDGFMHQFNDNDAAMRKFISYMECKIPAKMTMRVLMDNKGLTGIEMEKVIINTVDALRLNISTTFNKIKLYPIPYRVSNFPDRVFHNIIIDPKYGTPAHMAISC